MFLADEASAAIVNKLNEEVGKENVFKEFFLDAFVVSVARVTY